MDLRRVGVSNAPLPLQKNTCSVGLATPILPEVGTRRLGASRPVGFTKSKSRKVVRLGARGGGTACAVCSKVEASASRVTVGSHAAF